MSAGSMAVSIDFPKYLPQMSRGGHSVFSHRKRVRARQIMTQHIEQLDFSRFTAQEQREYLATFIERLDSADKYDKSVPKKVLGVRGLVQFIKTAAFETEDETMQEKAAVLRRVIRLVGRDNALNAELPDSAKHHVFHALLQLWPLLDFTPEEDRFMWLFLTDINAAAFQAVFDIWSDVEPAQRKIDFLGQILCLDVDFLTRRALDYFDEVCISCLTIDPKYQDGGVSDRIVQRRIDRIRDEVGNDLVAVVETDAEKLQQMVSEWTTILLEDSSDDKLSEFEEAVFAPFLEVLPTYELPDGLRDDVSLAIDRLQSVLKNLRFTPDNDIRMYAHLESLDGYFAGDDLEGMTPAFAIRVRIRNISEVATFVTSRPDRYDKLQQLLREMIFLYHFELMRIVLEELPSFFPERQQREFIERVIDAKMNVLLEAPFGSRHRFYTGYIRASESMGHAMYTVAEKKDANQLELVHYNLGQAFDYHQVDPYIGTKVTPVSVVVDLSDSAEKNRLRALLRAAFESDLREVDVVEELESLDAYERQFYEQLKCFQEQPSRFLSLSEQWVGNCCVRNMTASFQPTLGDYYSQFVRSEKESVARRIDRRVRSRLLRLKADQLIYAVYIPSKRRVLNHYIYLGDDFFQLEKAHRYPDGDIAQNLKPILQAVFMRVRAAGRPANSFESSVMTLCFDDDVIARNRSGEISNEDAFDILQEKLTAFCDGFSWDYFGNPQFVDALNGKPDLFKDVFYNPEFFAAVKTLVMPPEVKPLFRSIKDGNKMYLRGHIDLVKANIFTRNRSGLTLLEWAVRFCRTKRVESYQHVFALIFQAMLEHLVSNDDAPQLETLRISMTDLQQVFLLLPFYDREDLFELLTEVRSRGKITDETLCLFEG